VFVFVGGADTSLEDFPMPNVNQFVDVALPPPASRRRADGHDTGTVLPRNQLDYQYAEHHKPPIAPYVDRSDSAIVRPSVISVARRCENSVIFLEKKVKVKVKRDPVDFEYLYSKCGM